MLVHCWITGSVRWGRGTPRRASYSARWASVGVKGMVRERSSSAARSSLPLPGGARALSGVNPWVLNCWRSSCMESRYASTSASDSEVGVEVLVLAPVLPLALPELSTLYMARSIGCLTPTLTLLTTVLSILYGWCGRGGEGRVAKSKKSPVLYAAWAGFRARHVIKYSRDLRKSRVTSLKAGRLQSSRSASSSTWQRGYYRMTRC